MLIRFSLCLMAQFNQLSNLLFLVVSIAVPPLSSDLDDGDRLHRFSIGRLITFRIRVVALTLGTLKIVFHPRNSRQTHNPLPSIIVQIKSILLKWHVFSVFRLVVWVHLYRHPIGPTWQRAPNQQPKGKPPSLPMLLLPSQFKGRNSLGCVHNAKTTLTWPRNDRTTWGWVDEVGFKVEEI